MIVAGLDWSMSAPAICVYDTKKEFTFNNCQFFFYMAKAKYDKSFANIHGFMSTEWKDEQERFDKISEWGITILKKYHVNQACLEGYSMGSSAGRVFNIAENIGLLKWKMWKANIPFITPAPTQVKKHFTGKGNAKKELMYESLTTEQPDVKLTDLLNCKSGDSPISDIVDSYAMVSFLLSTGVK